MEKRRIVLLVDVDKLNQGLAETGGGEDIFGLGGILDGTESPEDGGAEMRQMMGIEVESASPVS